VALRNSLLRVFEAKKCTSVLSQGHTSPSSLVYGERPYVRSTYSVCMSASSVYNVGGEQWYVLRTSKFPSSSAYK
jgi:hypothetical protein